MLDRDRRRTTLFLALALALGMGPRAYAQSVSLPVRVVNGASHPLPVVLAAPADVNVLTLPPVESRPAKTPFQRELYIEVPSGTMSATQSFMVPAGRRLVIEFVAGNTRLSDWEYVRLTLRTIAGGESVGHELAPTPYRRAFEGSQPPYNPDLVIGFSQLVKVYADPGTSVNLTFLRTENREASPAGLTASVSGYLVDCGTDPACPAP